MEVNLIGEALKFMVMGMGIVFLFLTIMIYVLKVQAYLIAKYLPEKEISSSKTKEWQPANQTTDDKNIIAAITGAIIHHNNNTKSKG